MGRMKANRAVALALAATAVSVAGPAAAAATGETYSHAAAIFQIGAGARPLAMGGAFAGVADDENALFYNPAGLAFWRRAGLTSFYSTQYEVVGYGALGLALPGFGLGALYLSSPGIAGAGPDSQILPEFAYTNLAGLVGTAGHLGPLAVGIRGKYLSVTSAAPGTLETVNGSGFSGDAAALVALGPFRVGLVYENLMGQGLRYSTGFEEPWERRLTAGASVRLGPLLLAADVESLGGGGRFYHAGAELTLGLLALRAGATGSLTGSGSPDQERDLSAGAGLRLGGLQVDYAYLMPSALPETHRISLTLRF